MKPKGTQPTKKNIRFLLHNKKIHSINVRRKKAEINLEMEQFQLNLDYKTLEAKRQNSICN